MNESNSLVDKLNKSVKTSLNSSTLGTGILTSVIILSGILSAIFFWRHSAAVFGGLPVALATVLGLAIGLIPSEGAFFGWKRIRATKTDMTETQLRASDFGLWAAVGFAVANVIAIFISSFSAIPAAVQQLSVWITFFALMLPIPVQFILYAQFVINEQSVVENHAKAQLAALTHAAYIRGETARIGAVLEGMNAELNNTLAGYGASVGSQQAASVLRDGNQNLVGQFYDSGPRTVPSERQQITAADIEAFIRDNPQLLQLVRPLDNVSQNTHTPSGHDNAVSGPVTEQGEGEKPNGVPRPRPTLRQLRRQ